MTISSETLTILVPIALLLLPISVGVVGALLHRLLSRLHASQQTLDIFDRCVLEAAGFANDLQASLVAGGKFDAVTARRVALGQASDKAQSFLRSAGTYYGIDIKMPDPDKLQSRIEQRLGTLPDPDPKLAAAPPTDAAVPSLTREEVIKKIRDLVATQTDAPAVLPPPAAPLPVPVVAPPSVKTLTGPCEIPESWRPVQDTLARTIWAEARSEGQAGMEAVANVVINRALHPRWWGHDVKSVCLAPKQFSCWNEEDKQHEMIHAVNDSDPLFRQALDVAARALRGDLPDRTNGADHYVNLADVNPDWAHVPNKPACAIIGRHTFFRLEL